MNSIRKQVLRGMAAVAILAVAGPSAGGVFGQAAQEAAPLGAQHVYDRFVEIVGGVDALKKYQSSHASGTFSMPSQGIEGNLEVFGAAPNKILVRVEVPGFGLIRNGFDGEVGWTINPAVGPMVLDGDQLEQMRQQADFYGALNRHKFLASAEVVEDVDFEGRMCHKIAVVTNWGEEYTEFYDVETGLFAGNIRNQESPMGAMEATTIVSEYKEFSGVLLPTRSVQRVMGVEQILSITSMEYDSVDASVFDLPEEIKALLEGQ